MSKVVESVREHVTKAVKAKSTTVQAPSKWAAEAGFEGSTASSLRAHIARASDNGVGRTGRYPKVTAEGMLELIELGDAFAEAEGAKQAAIAKRIGSKVKPAAKTGARQAKTRTRSKGKTKTAA